MNFPLIRRLELITFADFDPEMAPFMGIDYEFSNIDWLEPDLSHLARDRRFTTPLASLKTQSLHNEVDEEPDEPRRPRPSKGLW